MTDTKHGKKNCPHCKGIPEEVIENAFVKSYQLLCADQHEAVSGFLQKVEDVLNEESSLKRLPKIEKEMADLNRRKEKLLDLRLDNNIDRDVYEKKNQELSEQLKITFVYKTGDIQAKRGRYLQSDKRYFEPFFLELR